MPYAESYDGTRIAYERRGPSAEPTHDSPCVLLIMGFAGLGEAWGEVADKLVTKGRQVIFFDNRGVGDSGAPRGPYTMAMMARDAIAVLDAAGLDKAHVTGVSMGGMIAQEVALLARERVATLSLIATHAGGPKAVLPTRHGFRHFLRGNMARGDGARLDALEQLLFPQAFLDACDRKQLRQRLAREFGHDMSRQARFSQFAAVLRHNTGLRLPGLIGLKTLLVRPGQDLLVKPREMDRLHACIPGSRLARFDEAGHGIIRQSPDKLVRVLLEHFDLIR